MDATIHKEASTTNTYYETVTATTLFITNYHDVAVTPDGQLDCL